MFFRKKKKNRKTARGRKRGTPVFQAHLNIGTLTISLCDARYSTRLCVGTYDQTPKQLETELNSPSKIDDSLDVNDQENC